MPSEHDIAFPRLSRAQIDALRPWGRVRPIAPGDVLGILSRRQMTVD